MDDYISRQAAIDVLADYIHNVDKVIGTGKLSTADCRDAAESVLEDLPSAQPEIIRCTDCKWWGYDDDDGVVRVCHAAKHGHMSSHWSIMIYRQYKGDYYCADAERRE